MKVAFDQTGDEHLGIRNMGRVLGAMIKKFVFVQGGSPTPHPFSSRPHFVCKFSRQRSTEVFQDPGPPAYSIGYPLLR